MAKKVLIQNLSEPLGSIHSVKYDIKTGTGNLTIDPLSSGDENLASGSLEYMEKQGPPAWSVDAKGSQATLTLNAKGGRQAGFRLPWSGCNGETNWQIHLNPTVMTDVTASSGGGNVKVDLSGMKVCQVSADSGGGNLNMYLPDHAANLGVMARSGGGNVSVELGSDTSGNNKVTATSGAGNVTVRLPAGIAARIHASTGMGKLIMDPRFRQIDKNNFESPEYDNAADKVEITAKSGAGNVSVTTK